ncbi:reverse transcriptase [Aphelenchoides avenae]|nr:reverse transcriptase [Aphelenchus avenae]
MTRPGEQRSDSEDRQQQAVHHAKIPVQTTFGKPSKTPEANTFLYPSGLPSHPDEAEKPGKHTGTEGPGAVRSCGRAATQGRAATRPAEQKMLHRCRAHKLRFATFNLAQSGAGGTDKINSNGYRLNEIMDAVGLINFEVVGLAETHTMKSQQYTWPKGKLAGAEILLVSSDAGQNNSTIGGVGFIVHSSIACRVHSVNFPSSRIGILKLKAPGQRVPIKIVQVYAPHSGYADEDHDQFYLDLQAALAEPSCRTIVMGDFNARTGTGEFGEQYVGKFSAEERNEAGQRMVTFAEANKLYVTNTFYQKPRKKRWTWQSADGVTRSELDYILCDNKNCVLNVETLARFEARSDHKIVRATLNLDLPKVKRDKALAAKRKLPTTISDRLLQRKIADADWKTESCQRVNEHYKALENTLLECVKESKVKRAACREPRITEETRALMRRLKQLKQDSSDPDACRRLSHLVRERLVQDYNDYRNRRLVETAEARQSLKNCRRNLAQTRQIAGALRDEEGELQTEREAIEEVCRRF